MFKAPGRVWFDDTVVHLLPPHLPYPAPPPFGGRFDPDYRGGVEGFPDTLLGINEGLLAIAPRDLEHLRLQYQENLAYADDAVGRLLAALDTHGLQDETAVVVTADHGEAFREHGVLLHTTTLYEEMIHVPLVMRVPRALGTLPRRWPGVVELRDVGATLAHALDVPHPRAARSLLGPLRGGEHRARGARAWTDDETGVSLATLVTDRCKVVIDGRARRLALYDLA